VISHVGPGCYCLEVGVGLGFFVWFYLGFCKASKILLGGYDVYIYMMYMYMMYMHMMYMHMMYMYMMYMHMMYSSLKWLFLVNSV
jgi:hypothetical protein